jgi:hypothetical protein
MRSILNSFYVSRNRRWRWRGIAFGYAFAFLALFVFRCLAFPPCFRTCFVFCSFFVNKFALFQKSALIPVAIFERPEAHDCRLQLAPFGGRDSEHPREPCVVIWQAASIDAPRDHHKLKVSAVLLQAQVPRVCQIGITE